MKKLCLFLAAALILSLLCACGDNKVEYEEGEGEFTEADGELFSDVPTDKIGGTFTVLNSETGSPASAFTADEIDGNNLNEAIYRRRVNVEARLGITIEEIRGEGKACYELAVQSILANDNIYDTLSLPASYAATLAVNGYLYNVSSLTEINLEKPWWNTSLSLDASVAENMYYLFGDIQQDMRDAYSVVCVNMEMVADTSGISDPYAVVDSGAWTVDKMLQMMRLVARDVDGDAVLDNNDIYGAAFNSDSMLSLLCGMGQKLFDKSSDSTFPAAGFYTETMVDADSLREKLILDNSTYYQEKMKKSIADAKSARAMFKSGKALFYITTVGNLYSLRETDWEIGLLPMPKAGEHQRDYVSLLPAELASVVCVPIISRNPEKVSTVLENLAAESYRKDGVADCYLNTVLQFRYMNDEKSRQNLNTVLAGGVVDLGNVYNWGGVSDIAKNSTGSEYMANILKYRNKIENEMLDTVEKLELVR